MDHTARALSEVQLALRNAATGDAAAASRKFVPTSVKVYGVRLPAVNDLARKYKGGGFALVRALWESGAFEERLLAAKLLGAVARTDGDQTLALVEEFASGVADWAVCDTIGMQSVKAIATKYEGQIFEVAKRLARSPAMWPRRLAIVLLTHYAKQPARRGAIQEIVRPLRGEKEHYIKKALAWLDRDLGVESS